MDSGADTAELGAEGFGEGELISEELGSGLVEQPRATERGPLRTIYFSFDSSELDDVALRTLEENARWLRQHPDNSAVVEGHCDERGTIEYNLGLGARRARSVRDHLVRLGIDSGRLRTISYGEERPADPGHDEMAWSKNRRVEFQVLEP
ncbi:MAG: peptidoglycan-associated lipoprotein Pal [Acidobacteriota bacterium]|nr:MAG: peptidoglycan-associated lipoprotein Pal [Acidobacteriota bacterium]